MRILVAGDDGAARDSLMKGLRGGNFSAEGAASGGEFRECEKKGKCDAAVIDLGSGQMEEGWFETIRMLRERGAGLPILVISPETSPVSKALVLDLGADDCVARPFAMVEILARLRALLRREKKVVGTVLAVGDITLEAASRRVMREGKQLALGRREFDLLEYLMRNAGVPVARDAIFRHIWNADADAFTNTVDVHISFLRAKIDRGRPESQRMIKTIYGYGYSIHSGDSA